ncbi:MAG: ankyrin repeat domain-containing protein [Clostridiales bacterium]|nr:ankyrin repeat domain-containing protein [Clostridiales bacterium]
MKKSKFTPEELMLRACILGDKREVEILLERGVKVNIADKAGYTPLMYASGNGDLELVKFLVGKGAKVNVRDKDGFNSLGHAFGKWNKELVNYLVEKGAQVDVKDKDGFTPLMIACIRGKMEAVKCLVEKGAQVNVSNNKGFTPLTRAWLSRNMEMSEYLIEHGASILKLEKYLDYINEDVTEEYPVLNLMKAIYLNDVERLDDLGKFFETYWRNHNKVVSNMEVNRIIEKNVKADWANNFANSLKILLPKLNEMKKGNRAPKEVNKIDNIRKQIVGFIKAARREFEMGIIQNISQYISRSKNKVIDS